MAGILVVTGGSRGIGAATVQLAASKGWDVCVNYVRDQTRAEAVAADARKHGVRAITVQGGYGAGRRYPAPVRHRR